MKILIILALSILSGYFYRRGGTDKGTLWRDMGSSLCMSVSLLVLFGIHGWKESITIWLSFGLMWAALTTYRYFLPKPKNYTGWHYALHGFMVSLAIFPWAIVSGHLLGMGIRCAACAIFVGLWSHFIGWDELEEWGRGFIFNLTILLLLI